jgi:peptidyl-prolyl cis-trans isomerase A (cyclophilin A)
MNIFKLASFLTLILIFAGCSHKSFPSNWAKITAPAHFKASFETTQGNFEIESYREWSPLAVDRLYQLITTGFYTDIAFFRIEPGYVVQFGISNDSSLNNYWEAIKLPDEKVVKPNIANSISFARGGPKSRTTQIFINLVNNSPYLDTLAYGNVKGFPVVANVTSGIDVVKKLYSGYKGEPAMHQDLIYQSGNTYLKKAYPKLDYIKKAVLLKEK